MNGNGKHIYIFGPYHLDTVEHLLTLNEQIVPLPPKVIDTLSILVENRGRVISKDELMQSLWPDTFVEESNLTQNISQIRRALSDGSPEIKYIETIPKRGYRFTVDVQTVNGINGKTKNGDVAEPTLNIAMAESAHYLESSRATVDEFKIRRTYQEPSIESNIRLNSRNISAFVISLVAGIAILSFALYVAWNKPTGKYDALFDNPQFVKLTNSGKAVTSAVSNNGKYVAYAIADGDLQSLHVSQIESPNDVQIASAEDISFIDLKFSPDDQFIYYVAKRKGDNNSDVYRVPFLGGVSKKVLSGIVGNITLSPDGHNVAFVRATSGFAETSLVIASLDGAGERLLAVRKRPTLFSIRALAWSPNGKYIACSILNWQGSETTERLALINVINGEEGTSINHVWSHVDRIAWLPDNNGLVFIAWNMSSGVYGDPLWIMSLADKKVRRITKENVAYKGIATSIQNNIISTIQADRVSRMSIATLTPSGFKEDVTSNFQSGFSSYFSEFLGLSWALQGKIVYASQLSGSIDVWISDRDGSNQTKLTSEPQTDTYPVVTPDARYIVFQSQRNGHSNLWRIGLDGKNLKQLTRGIGDTYPSITPDGKTVIYTSWTNDQYNLWKVSIEGGQPVQINDRRLIRPEVSPDGKWIACGLPKDKGIGFDLALLSVEGGEPKIIDNIHTPEYGFYKWHPDGKSITYIRTINGVSNIWGKPIDGGDPKQLTSFTADRIFRFAWSPDGKQLACERGININDVVVIK